MNPQFVNAGNGDYHLQSTSLCIDEGFTTGMPGTDLDGNLRVDVAGVGDPLLIFDMGAYEYIP